jgi:hypothetical protein
MKSVRILGMYVVGMGDELTWFMSGQASGF